MFRGLSATIAREMPSYAFYFATYGFLIAQWRAVFSGLVALQALGPLVCGGLAGMAAWLPVYPIDVVKTEMQNCTGGETQSCIGGNADEALTDQKALSTTRPKYFERRHMPGMVATARHLYETHGPPRPHTLSPISPYLG